MTGTGSRRNPIRDTWQYQLRHSAKLARQPWREHEDRTRAQLPALQYHCTQTNRISCKCYITSGHSGIVLNCRSYTRIGSQYVVALE